MTTAADWTELFQKIGATKCPKCHALALVEEQDHADGRITLHAVSASARFCFECGYQTAGDAHTSGRVTTP